MAFIYHFSFLWSIIWHMWGYLVPSDAGHWQNCDTTWNLSLQLYKWLDWQALDTMSDPVYNFDVSRAPKEKPCSWLSSYTVIVIGSHCCYWLCDNPFQTLELLAFDLPITCIPDWSPCCILSPQVKHLNTQEETGCKLQLCTSLRTLTNQWHWLAVEETHILSQGMCLSAINKWTVVTKSDLIVLLCTAQFKSVLLSIRVSAGEGRIRFNAERAVSLLHMLSSRIICQLPPPLLWICGPLYHLLVHNTDGLLAQTAQHGNPHWPIISSDCVLYDERLLNQFRIALMSGLTHGANMQMQI